MTTPALVCATAEIALNRYLALEPQALRECAALDGRSIELHALQLDWSLCIEFHAASGGGLRVLPALPQPADVRVSGAPRTLLQLALGAAQGQARVPPGLRVDGDVELLQRFSRLLADVGFDADELAAHVFGDAAGVRAMQGLRGVLNWGGRSAQTLALDTAEYLREETGDLARASDVEEWARAVERLRDDVARFEVRLRRLEARKSA